MIFISLVGRQVMAVLNPILALKDSGRNISQVHLLATPQTTKYASSLEPNLKAPCTIHEISDTLLEENSRLPAQELVRQIVQESAGSGEEIGFNIAGGMNFQVSACVLALEGNPYWWIYPESDGISLFKMTDKGTQCPEQLPLPSPQDVFDCQGMKCELLSLKASSKLHRLLKKVGRNQLVPARVCTDTGEIVFDGMINRGNELRFVKVIKADSSKNSRYFDREVKDLISLAGGRGRFGELYHRSIALLTDHALAAEKVEKLALAGKIRLFWYDSREPEKTSSALEAFLFPPEQKEGQKLIPEIPVKTGAEKSKGPHLVVTIGTDIVPTLTAYFSHQPKAVTFLYTPGIEPIDKHLPSLIEESRHFSASTVSFVPVDFPGTKILDREPPEEGAPIEVNVTPGTKLQAAFLTKWARNVGAGIFSLDTRAGKLTRIDGDETRPMRASPPVVHLKCSGVPVLEYGSNAKGMSGNKKKTFGNVVKFLKKLKKAGSRRDFPYKPIKIGPWRYKPDPNSPSLYCKGKPMAQWKTSEWREGIFFEKLVGYCLQDCGFQDIQLELKIRMDPETEEHVREKYPESYKDKRPRLTDIDVVGRKDWVYFIISCKAGPIKEEDWDRIAIEVDAVAKVFGRFAVPLICAFQFEGNPDFNHQKVCRFGWKTLIDKDELCELLERALKERRK